jgi:hypothetical protein
LFVHWLRSQSAPAFGVFYVSPDPEAPQPAPSNARNDLLKLTALVVALICSAWLLNKLFEVLF